MKRLAVILPYSEEHIENFTDHFKATVPESGDLYYKLVFLKQINLIITTRIQGPGANGHAICDYDITYVF